MIHWILQFALRIAFRCVLHRCGSQDIRRQELYGIFAFVKTGGPLREAVARSLSAFSIRWFVRIVL